MTNTPAPTSSNFDVSRRSFFKLFGGIAATSVLATSVFSLTGCGEQKEAAFDATKWDEVLATAKGEKVSWYGWGGDQARNNWITQVLAPRLKEKYNVTLERVDMDINDILTQLSGEIQANKEIGSIDFIWINGENFYSCKQNGYLWGPFTQNLPNYNQYVDGTSLANLYDFGSPIEGYEAPYGKTQFQMWCDSAKVSASEMPTSLARLKSFVQAHPGTVTYPEPGDFVGTAFIESVIAGVVGTTQFAQLSAMSKDEATEEKVLAIVKPGLEYLKELAPYLWKQGKTYPSASTELSTMYADGELLIDTAYGAPVSQVNNGTLPATTKGFIFDSGTVGNQNFNAIAKNAPHKAAAMVAINEILSPEMQLSIYEQLGGLSPLDMSKLDAQTKAAFDNVTLIDAQIPADQLAAHAILEASGPVVPILESLWRSTVLG